jgi:hypothetical protein
MRRIILVLAVPLSLGLMAQGALASSVHLKGGAHAKPSFTDNGLTLTATGALSGLGNGNVAIVLSATANPTATCGNPGTNTFQAPGQNPASVTVTGSQFIPESSIDKNGNVGFNVTTDRPTTPIPNAPDCPNTKWTEIITDMAFTSATIQVYQPANADGTGGTLVLTVSCTFSSQTVDGPVPSGNVTCTSS